jgi:exosortase
MKLHSRLPELAALALALSLFIGLYARVFVDLAGVWTVNENYSHAPLLIPVIGYLIWSRREALAGEPLRPANSGIVLILGSLLVFLLATAAVEFFLMRTSAVGVIAGSVVFVAGWRWLRMLLFPLSLFGLMIPIPPVLFYQATFPLQLLATKFGVLSLQMLEIPVLREGNVITLPHTTLEVTEACSGIRSLVSLFSLAVLYGYFTDGRPGRTTVISLLSIPIALVSNGVRVAGTGIAAHFVGPSAATGFFHSFSGWLMFMTSFGLLLLVAGALKRVPSFDMREPEVSPA